MSAPAEPQPQPWDGRPPQAAVDGWHWLEHRDTGSVWPVYWHADNQGWWPQAVSFGAYAAAEQMGEAYLYLAPCPFPHGRA